MLNCVTKLLKNLLISNKLAWFNAVFRNFKLLKLSEILGQYY
jgi:hypothetical protein